MLPPPGNLKILAPFDKSIVARGDYGCSRDLVKSLYYAVEYCALCGEMFSPDNVCILESAAQYLVHVGFLTGDYLMRVHKYLAILRKERTFRQLSSRSQRVVLSHFSSCTSFFRRCHFKFAHTYHCPAVLRWGLLISRRLGVTQLHHSSLLRSPIRVSSPSHFAL